MQRILPATVPVKKTKGAVRQSYGDGDVVARCEQALTLGFARRDGTVADRHDTELAPHVNASLSRHHTALHHPVHTERHRLQVNTQYKTQEP